MQRLHSYIKTWFYIAVLITVMPLSCRAGTIVLKNGMTFTSKKIWQENGEIKCYLNGLVVGFAKEDVDRIDNTPVGAREMTAAVSEHNADPDLSACKENLESKQKALALEYQALIQTVGQLEKARQQITSPTAAQALDNRIKAHNQKVAAYMRKKKDFDVQIDACQRRAQQANWSQWIDEEEFAGMLRTWLKRPVKDFIDQWGYPDTIINLPHSNQRYLFNIEILPERIRQIAFDTDPAGIIVKLAVRDVKGR